VVVLVATLRTCASWQRTGLNCIVYGVVLSKVFVVNDLAIGVIFGILASAYSIAAFVQTEKQLATHLSHHSFMVNNRMVVFSSTVTLLAYFFLLFYF